MNRNLRICIVIVMALSISACSRQESSTNNSKMVQSQSSETTDSTNSQSSGDVDSTNDLGSENMSDILQSLDQAEAEDVIPQSTAQPGEIDITQSNPLPHSTLNYNCDIEKDRETFDAENIDITVGDNYYSTQINDWYMNYNQYKGKTVEIEGYYIADYLPYLFVGRFGPTCPYCQGAYVCFEFYTKQDLSELISGKDWIKVKGILREDEDGNGKFCYIEAMSVEKMDEVGLDTITN